MFVRIQSQGDPFSRRCLGRRQEQEAVSEAGYGERGADHGKGAGREVPQQRRLRERRAADDHAGQGAAQLEPRAGTCRHTDVHALLCHGTPVGSSS